ncbi:MAG: AAA family ATPase [Planctomycetota bacterium]
MADQLVTKITGVEESPTLTAITVGGYKCIPDEQSIEVRPLTILAGANSSGKSTVIQPLLLLKQTLEAPYDPGALKLDGPNVRFTSSDQLLSRTRSREQAKGFHVGMSFDSDLRITTYLERKARSGFDTVQTTIARKGRESTVRRGMSSDEYRANFTPDDMEKLRQGVEKFGIEFNWEIVRERCFLHVIMNTSRKGDGQQDTNKYLTASVAVSLMQAFVPETLVSDTAAEFLEHLIHVPGHRGNPERTYPVTNVGETFPGVFQNYVASMIAHWQEQGVKQALKGVSNDFERLGLSWKVVAKRVADSQVEISVGRVAHSARGSDRDLVSIADVGFGLSQVLPVVVALRAASPKNLVYLEEPEIHLHPRAQVALAELLCDAVKRGVKMVVETHSALLLLALQALVADGKLPSELVKLHWFTRSETDGATHIHSADLDEAGAYGDWPEDFGDVELDIEKRYLDAAEAKMKSD